MFIAEVAPKSLKHVLKSLVEILASIPSVVLGFLGIIWLGPVLRNVFGLTTGMCGLTGSLLLAFMALPTIISISEDALVACPGPTERRPSAWGHPLADPLADHPAVGFLGHYGRVYARHRQGHR